MRETKSMVRSSIRGCCTRRDRWLGKFLASGVIMIGRKIRPAPRAEPAAGNLGMANADGRAATATGKDHGFHGQSSLASLV
jgi:hypothetical protein